jgi:hypothetical protein
MGDLTAASLRNKYLGYFLAALIISAIMFVGFAKNFYLRAWIGTRPITAMVHVHGIVMTAWILLFLTQALLVAKGRTDLHRKLGMLGAFLAIIVVALGTYTISRSILRQQPGVGLETFALTFVAFDGLSLLLFGALVFAALRLRIKPQSHKRLMLMALVSLLPPAFGRFVAYFTRVDVFQIVLILMCASVLICITVDALWQRRVNITLVWSGALVVVINVVTRIAQAVTDG